MTVFFRRPFVTAPNESALLRISENYGNEQTMAHAAPETVARIRSNRFREPRRGQAGADDFDRPARFV